MKRKEGYNGTRGGLLYVGKRTEYKTFQQTEEVFKVLSCFSGIAGLELGIAVAGLSNNFQVTQFIEKSKYCQQVLQQHYPNIPIHEDIKTFTSELEDFDIICGGFPCTDISIAGKQAGIAPNTRSGLFFELMRVVRLVRPQFVLLENVSNLLANGMGIVLQELSCIGYDAEWSLVSAAEVGAVHRRERIFIIAWRQSDVNDTQCSGTGMEKVNASDQGGRYPQSSEPALV